MSKCNCENIHCPHGEKPCPHPAGVARMEYVGHVCDNCARAGWKYILNKDEFEDREWEKFIGKKKDSMKLSDKLLIVAGWLESAENDLLVSAEANEQCLEVVAKALVAAAEAVYTGAEEIEKLEPKSEGLTSEKLDEMAAIAQAFDESEDELLQKQASVLDEILLTIAVPKNAVAEAKKAADDRIEELKKKYKDTKSKQDEMNKVSDSLEKIQKAPMYKKYRVLEAPLSTRYCPSHFGVSVARVGEHKYQCPLDGKIYDYESGFVDLDGNKTPGGSVSEQTKVPQQTAGEVIFDTRNQRLGAE